MNKNIPEISGDSPEIKTLMEDLEDVQHVVDYHTDMLPESAIEEFTNQSESIASRAVKTKTLEDLANLKNEVAALFENANAAIDMTNPEEDLDLDLDLGEEIMYG